jgi:predicted nucleotidyltransferase
VQEICRIDIGRGEETYSEIGYKLKELAKLLRGRYKVSKIIVFGSYVRGDLNEGSDIDLVIVGDFKENFHKRIAEIIGLIDLPIEPLCYTEEEFREMVVNKNTFMSEVLKEGVAI